MAGVSFLKFKKDPVSEKQSNSPQNAESSAAEVTQKQQASSNVLTFTPTDESKKQTEESEAKDKLLKKIQSMMPEATLASDESIHDIMDIVDISEIPEEERELNIEEVLNSSSNAVPSLKKLKGGNYIMAPEGLKKTD